MGVGVADRLVEGSCLAAPPPPHKNSIFNDILPETPWGGERWSLQPRGWGGGPLRLPRRRRVDSLCRHWMTIIRPARRSGSQYLMCAAPLSHFMLSSTFTSIRFLLISPPPFKNAINLNNLVWFQILCHNCKLPRQKPASKVAQI
jgi:hypothetical protein